MQRNYTSYLLTHRVKDEHYQSVPRNLAGKHPLNFVKHVTEASQSSLTREPLQSIPKYSFTKLLYAFGSTSRVAYEENTSILSSEKHQVVSQAPFRVPHTYIHSHAYIHTYKNIQKEALGCFTRCNKIENFFFIFFSFYYRHLHAIETRVL